MALTGNVDVAFDVDIVMDADPGGVATVTFTPPDGITINSGSPMTFNSGNFSTPQQLNVTGSSVSTFSIDYDINTDWSIEPRTGSFIVTITEAATTVDPDSPCGPIPTVTIAPEDGSILMIYDRQPTTPLGTFEDDTRPGSASNPSHVCGSVPTITVLPALSAQNLPSYAPAFDQGNEPAYFGAAPPSINKDSVYYKNWVRRREWMDGSDCSDDAEFPGTPSSTFTDLQHEENKIINRLNLPGGRVGSAITYDAGFGPFKIVATLSGCVEVDAIFEEILDNVSTQFTHADNVTLHVGIFERDTSTLLMDIGSISVPTVQGAKDSQADSTISAIKLDNVTPFELLNPDITVPWTVGVYATGFDYSPSFPPPWPSAGPDTGMDPPNTTQSLERLELINRTINRRVYDPILDALEDQTGSEQLFDVEVEVLTAQGEECRPVFELELGETLTDKSILGDQWHDPITGEELYTVRFKLDLGVLYVGNMRFLNSSVFGSNPSNSFTLRAFRNDDFTDQIGSDIVKSNHSSAVIPIEFDDAADSQQFVYCEYESNTKPPTNSNHGMKPVGEYREGSDPSNPSSVVLTDMQTNWHDENGWMYFSIVVIEGDYDIGTEAADVSPGGDVDTLMEYYGTDSTYSTLVSSDDNSGPAPAYSQLPTININAGQVGQAHYFRVRDKNNNRDSDYRWQLTFSFTPPTQTGGGTTGGGTT